MNEAHEYSPYPNRQGCIKCPYPREHPTHTVSSAVGHAGTAKSVPSVASVTPHRTMIVAPANIASELATGKMEGAASNSVPLKAALEGLAKLLKETSVKLEGASQLVEDLSRL